MNSNLAKKTPEELYYLGKIVDRLLAYYDNQMQANEGNYTMSFQKIEYQHAKFKRDLYTKLKEDIIEAMESIAIAEIADSKYLEIYKSKLENIGTDEETVDKH